ncbi:unnamed protein product [Ophioblennius macclurei]
MGNCCCPTESPCGTVEERSGLLKDDSKATTCTVEPVVVGTCGPEGDDDMRKSPDEQAKAVPAKPENGLTELSNTQENGPLQTESIQTATPSPQRASELKENGTTAQDKDMNATPAASDCGKAELPQCTLNPQPEESTTAERDVFVASNAEVKEEDSSSVQEKNPDGASRTEDATRPVVPLQTETHSAEHITASAPPHDDGGEGEPHSTQESPEVLTQSNEESVETKTPPPPPPAAADLLINVPVVIPEELPLSSAEPEEVDDSVSPASTKETRPEHAENPDVRPSVSGFDRSETKQDSLNSATEPETSAPADASEGSEGSSLNSDQDAAPDPDGATSLNEAPREEVMPEVQNEDEDEDVPEVKEDKEMREPEEPESASAEARAQATEETEGQETSETENEEQTEASVTVDATAAVVPVGEKDDSLGNSEEDEDGGAEELSASQSNKAGQPPSLESQLLKVEDRCSLSPAVDVLLYGEREWKGNTAKSALIKKGYKEMSQRFGGVRRVRGDNYCALRATLFQVLSHSTHLPAWLQEDGFTTLPQQLAAQEGLIGQWTFPGECLQGDGTRDATQQLAGYLELLQNKWRAAVDCASAPERQQLCERVFQGGEEELGLLEALKLLMLSRAAELHARMQAGEDVPLFCWLLFARDSSDCPHAFLANHLSHVGLSAGLEQVEMFLLGYALQCTIQVYRLYKADTEEFVTYYPDDHKDDWPSVCLVTEDDRHYNVPVAEAAAATAAPQEQLASS